MSAAPRSVQPGDLPPGAPPGALPPSRAARLPDLGIRAASGFSLIFVALASTMIGGDVFLAAWLLAGAAVHFEWQRLVGGPARLARLALGIVGLAGIAWLTRGESPWATGLLLAIVALVAALAGPGRRVWAAAGAAYAGLFVQALTALRFSHPDGARAMLWLFCLVWATDVFAYLGGRLIGGPKLWPRISPSKTWSGTLTGLAAGALIGTFSALRDRFDWPALVPILALTLTAGLVSQAGDAFESAIKRHFGVKDTSRLIPGHGGLMDRLDGFIAAAIFAYLFGLVRALASVAQGLFAWH